MCKDSHKKYIFDCLDEMNIDYDVYINVSGIIILKSICAYSGKLFYEKKEIIDDLFETSEHEFTQNDGYRKQLLKKLTDETVKENFYQILPKEKIKSFKIENWKVGELGENIHFFNSFPNTRFFKRVNDLKIQINNESYSHFINLRPDFKLKQSIDFDKLFNIEQDFTYMSQRIDYLTVSKRMLCDIFTEKNINLINNDTSIINLEKNSIYKNNIHFEVCYPEIFEKLNILLILMTSKAGVKLDILEL
jgi:hypothetical protein